MGDLYVNNFKEMQKRFCEILDKYSFVEELSKESYLSLLSIYHSLCRNLTLLSDSNEFKKVNEYVRLLMHLRNSTSSKTFELTFGGIRYKYSVEFIPIIEKKILEEFNKMVYKSSFYFEKEGILSKCIQFNVEGIEEYAIYYGLVDDDYNKDVWTDEDFDELIKFCKEREAERMRVEGRMGSRRFELGFWADEMMSHFPEGATKVDRHNCIYDLMLDSGYLNFNPPSKLECMNGGDETVKGTMVRDWIKEYKKSKDKLFIFNEE